MEIMLKYVRIALLACNKKQPNRAVFWKVNKKVCTGTKALNNTTYTTHSIGLHYVNIYYYNSNLIRSAGSRQDDSHGSPDQTRCRASSLI